MSICFRDHSKHLYKHLLADITQLTFRRSNGWCKVCLNYLRRIKQWKCSCRQASYFTLLVWSRLNEEDTQKRKFRRGEQNQNNNEKQIKMPFAIFWFGFFQYSCRRKSPCVFFRHLYLHGKEEARWEGFSDSLTWRGLKQGLGSV